MENASNALIMAAGVLIGVLILSLAGYLIYIFGNYNAEVNLKNEENLLNEFNVQFTKYYGNTRNVYINENGEKVVEDEVDGDEKNQILCSAHDIISLANLAKQNNIDYNYDIDDENLKGNESEYYIQIDVLYKASNIETYNKDKANEFIKYNSMKEVNGKQVPIYFVCTECDISKITGRVYHMKFKEIQKNK